MNVLGDSIGCAVVQANVELEPVKKVQAIEIQDAIEASSSLWSHFSFEIVFGRKIKRINSFQLS